VAARPARDGVGTGQCKGLKKVRNARMQHVTRPTCIRMEALKLGTFLRADDQARRGHQSMLGV
jgi:hypothetical protein